MQAKESCKYVIPADEPLAKSYNARDMFGKRSSSGCGLSSRNRGFARVSSYNLIWKRRAFWAIGRVGAEIGGFVARALKAVLAILVSLALSGCFFPEAGPSGREIIAGAERASVPYALVPLTENTVEILSATEPPGLAGAFSDRRPPSGIKIGVGDVVSVTVFESAAGGLFIPAEAGIRPGNYVELPNQIVDNDGNITVPYAGNVRAAGRTNFEVQNDIVEKIKDRAIQPQVVVAVREQRTNLISVVGEVNTPVRYPAANLGAGDRVLDAITRAGGIKAQGYESWVTLERKGRRATIPFENLVFYPSNNIYVQPGDRIYVYKDPQRYVVFGATGQQAEIPFDTWRTNLATAVAKAGGLLDIQADPGSVFLFRVEPRAVAEKLGVDMTRFQDAEAVPIVFSVSFRDPGGFFLAREVEMRNQDVLFVANAESVQFTKFLNFVNLAVLTTNNITWGVGLVNVASWNLRHPHLPPVSP